MRPQGAPYAAASQAALLLSVAMKRSGCADFSCLREG